MLAIVCTHVFEDYFVNIILPPEKFFYILDFHSDMLLPEQTYLSLKTEKKVNGDDNEDL